MEIKSVNGKTLYESPHKTMRETVEDAVRCGFDMSRANLRDADLRGADLRGADLRGADLREADLRDANLRDADLRGADLLGADLRGATVFHGWFLAQLTHTRKGDHVQGNNQG